MQEQAPEPAGSRDRWYYSVNARRTGPLTREELLEKLPDLEGEETWVKGPAMAYWKRARQVKALELDVEEESTPHPAFWLTYLFFMPRTFYRTFVIKKTPALTLVCAWIFGMAGVIDRIDTRVMTGRSLPFTDDWGRYWMLVGTVGIIGAFFQFFVGGWWYVMRLKLSGVPSPDVELARRVYLFASQILAVPAVVLAAYNTSHFGSPLEAAADGGSYWQLLFLLFPIWSVISSYIGVRIAFPVKCRGMSGARFWFLIVPIVFYMVFIYLAFQAQMAGVLTTHVKPDLQNTKTHQSEIINFTYPGNWTLDTAMDDYDFERMVYVESVVHDTMIGIMVYESVAGPEDELDASFYRFSHGLAQLEQRDVFTELGDFTGLGREYVGKVNGEPYVLRLFIATLDEGVLLETFELTQKLVEQAVFPGYDLIRRSLYIKGF